jgi:hypothetical protein
LRQWQKLPPIEEVRASIMRKLDALNRGRAAGLKFRDEV